MADSDLTVTRRECLTALAATALFPAGRVSAKEAKPMRGAFMILSTPYTSAGEVDYDDLAREVETGQDLFVGKKRLEITSVG